MLDRFTQEFDDLKEANDRMALSDLYITAGSSANGFFHLIPEEESLKTPEDRAAAQALRETVERLRLVVKAVEDELHQVDEVTPTQRKADALWFHREAG